MVGGSEEVLCVCEGSWPVISCGDVGGGGSRDKTGASVWDTSCPVAQLSRKALASVTRAKGFQ